VMQTIARDVGFAWIDAWLAAATERLVAELAREHERSVELARIALASGRGSQTEVLAARQMVGQAADRRLELAAQAERAKAALARWIPDATARSLPESLPALADPAPLADLRAALGSHPQHEMHALAQAVADAEVALAREAGKPDTSFEVGYYARSGDRSDMLMFQVAFELPLFAARKQDAQLGAKLRLAERAREQRADHLQQLRAELEAAHAEWRLAGERLKNLESSILPDARARLDALLAQHGAGGVSLAAVLDGRRGVIDARIQDLTLRATQAKANIALQYFADWGGHR
jgi:outer membrane protein TolC